MTARQGWTFQKVVFILALSIVTSNKNPPEILKPPQDMSVKCGGIAVFFCYATGDPAPSFYWRKAGKKLKNTDQRYLIGDFAGGSLLRIEPVRKKREGGRYECVAENGVGDEVSVHAELNVYDEKELPVGFPQIIQNPGMKVVEKGRNAVLVCEATGEPAPVITWIKDVVPIDLEGNPRLSIMQQGSLRIEAAQESDQGKYECVASNSVGTEHSYSAQLYVRVRRVPPHFTIQPDAKYEVNKNANLNITCVAVGSPMPFVKWREGANDITPENNVPIGKNVLTLFNIRETSNFTCVAASKLGVIETHTVVKVQALPRSPTQVRVTEVQSTSIRLSWSYDGDAGSEVLYYIIQYKPRAATWDYKEISGAITNFYDIRGLSPYTEYEFCVLAMNNVGRGEKSIPVLATTGETKPGGSIPGNDRPGSAPRNVQVRPLSSSTMVIQWDEPQEQNGLVTGYKVYFSTNPQLPLSRWESQFVDNNKLTTISDLTPHTIYTIRVEAYTSIGPGPLSNPVQVKTQQGVPSQPSRLAAAEVGSTSIKLSWEQPDHAGENILSYELYWNDTYTATKFPKHKSLEDPSLTSYTLENLYPNTLYHVWIAAKSRRGEGAATPKLPVRTDQYVPGAPPQSVSAFAESSTSLRVVWKPPPDNKQNGIIIYYKIFYVPSSRSDSEATVVEIKSPSSTEFVLDDLLKWTDYRVWMLAGTSVGDGPKSSPTSAGRTKTSPGSRGTWWRGPSTPPPSSSSGSHPWTPSTTASSGPSRYTFSRRRRRTCSSTTASPSGLPPRTRRSPPSTSLGSSPTQSTKYRLLR